MIYSANILRNIDETQQTLLGGMREQGKVEEGASKDAAAAGDWLLSDTGLIQRQALKPKLPPRGWFQIEARGLAVCTLWSVSHWPHGMGRGQNFLHNVAPIQQSDFLENSQNTAAREWEHWKERESGQGTNSIYHTV